MKIPEPYNGHIPELAAIRLALMLEKLHLFFRLNLHLISHLDADQLIAELEELVGRSGWRNPF